MANKQSNANEVIAQVVVEAARVTTQAMAAAGAERTQNVGPSLDRLIMKQHSTGKQKTNIMDSKTSHYR